MKIQKYLKNVLLLGALTITTWVLADATCPQCKDVSEGPHTISPVYGDERWSTYDPPKHICAEPNDSGFECLTSSDYTATTQETVWQIYGGDPYRDPVIISGPTSTTYNPCWTDDTECGGNG